MTACLLLRGLFAAAPLGTDAAWWAQGFLFSPALTVGGGTSEVLRNIVGERILELLSAWRLERGKLRGERAGKKIQHTYETNPGLVWEEDEFWIDVSWQIDPIDRLADDGIVSQNELRI